MDLSASFVALAPPHPQTAPTLARQGCGPGRAQDLLLRGEPNVTETVAARAGYLCAVNLGPLVARRTCCCEASLTAQQPQQQD